MEEYVHKLVIPKSYVTVSEDATFPDFDELVVDPDNPELITDGVSLLSKDGTKLFRMCSKRITSYTIPMGVQEICSYAFLDCKLTELTIPESVKSIGYNAFAMCTSLSTINGGDGIVSFKSNSFDYTPWYENADIRILGKTLIKYCTKEKNVIVPEGIEVIGTGAFGIREKLNSFWWKTYRGYKPDERLETVQLPDTIKHIGERAFIFHRALEKINLPEGLISIGKASFCGCNSLSNVNLPNGLLTIEEEAFRACTAFTSITIPDSIYIINPETFEKCRSLTEINFSDKVSVIGEKAFESCESLEEIIVPESVTAIGVGAFENCARLKKVSIPHPVSGGFVLRNRTTITTETLSAELFAGCRMLEHFEIPYGTVKIGNKAFSNCLSLTGIVLPDTITTIEDQAFENCRKLEGIELPQNVKKLGKDVFPHNNGMFISSDFKSITIDSENELFKVENTILYSKDGKKLIRVPSQYKADEYVIPDDVEIIGEGAFEGCPNIKKITIGPSVRIIEMKAFSNMINLESVVFLGTISVLAEWMFSNCKKLRDITWPRELKEIRQSCFEHTGFKNQLVIIPDTVKIINYRAFAWCGANTIRIPKSVDCVDPAAFLEAPELEVYDNIGGVSWRYNSKSNDLGLLVTDSKESIGYRYGSKHKIIVRSSEDDSIKYRVTIPKGQKGSVYDRFSSSWREKAKFNFGGIDRIFSDMTTEAKMDYTFERIHHLQGISNESMELLKKYIERNANNFMTKILEADDMEALGLFEPYGIIKKNKINDIMKEAQSLNAFKCQNWLSKWKEVNHVHEDACSSSEKTLTVSEIKKIWHTKNREDGSLEITGYFGRDEHVVIPEKIGKKDVTAISPHCFNADDNYSHYRDKAPRDFLKTQLKSVTIPNSVVEIGSFFKCESLGLVVLPENLKILPNGAFCFCPNLKELTIPESVVEIAERAIVGCDSLKQIIIPESVKKIADEAFSLWEPLERFHLPAGDIDIGERAFSRLSVKSFTVDHKSTQFKEIEGVLFSADGKTLYRYSAGRKDETYVVPDGVNTIWTYAFNESRNLKKITLPDSVQTIKDYAFSNCRSLETIQMPVKMKEIGVRAFERCECLSAITLPIGITTLSPGLFDWCKNLEEVTLPDGLKRIERDVFVYCMRLKEIVFPSSVEKISDSSFLRCDGLETVKASRKAVIESSDYVGKRFFTIYAPRDSSMYLYAKKHYIKVVEIEDY